MLLRLTSRIRRHRDPWVRRWSLHPILAVECVNKATIKVEQLARAPLLSHQVLPVLAVHGNLLRLGHHLEQTIITCLWCVLLSCRIFTVESLHCNWLVEITLLWLLGWAVERHLFYLLSAMIDVLPLLEIVPAAEGHGGCEAELAVGYLLRCPRILLFQGKVRRDWTLDEAAIGVLNIHISLHQRHEVRALALRIRHNVTIPAIFEFWWVYVADFVCWRCLLRRPSTVL